jgi:hypothetical protein
MLSRKCCYLYMSMCSQHGCGQLTAAPCLLECQWKSDYGRYRSLVLAGAIIADRCGPAHATACFRVPVSMNDWATLACLVLTGASRPGVCALLVQVATLLTDEVMTR